MQEGQRVPLYEARTYSSIPAMLREVADRYPDKTFVIEPRPEGGSVSTTFGELSRRVDSLARAILDLQEHPVVGVVGSNSSAWMTAYLAALRTGGKVVPIDRELSIPEMHAILHYAGGNIVFFDSRFQEGFRSRMTDLGSRVRMVCMGSGCDDGSALALEDMIASGADSARELPHQYDADAPASICYTSGTTGQAKGVVLSQRNILSVVRQMRMYIEISPEDVFLSVLPIHHTFECTCDFLGALSCAASLVVTRGLRYIADDVREHGITLMMGVPLLWEAIYRKIMDGVSEAPGGTLKLRFGLALSSMSERLTGRSIRRKVFSKIHEKLGGTLRLLVSGGAGIDVEVVRGFMDFGFDFIQGYGLTETAPIISVNHQEFNRPGSVGLPLPEMEVRFDDVDEEGVGEIVVRGPNVMLGYHENPEETRKVLSEDGWLKTGDYGYIDRDGFLHVTGRKKNVIVAKNGKNVYPEEIETLLGRSELLLETMVFGRESAQKGEEIWAIVFPDLDRIIAISESRGESVSRQRLVDLVRAEIKAFNRGQPTYKRIQSFIIREEEFPKTTTRKIKRREVLREAGLEQQEAHRA